MKQMPKESKPSKPSSLDMFQLLTGATEREKKKKREELLTQLGIKESLFEGRITIDKRTCKGLECKLCIKACPTNALYWKVGEVGLIEEHCIYCGACVLSCIVDDCIKIARKRLTGNVESFSKPRDFVTLQHSINTRKRFEKVEEAFPKTQDHTRKRKPTR